MKQDLCEAGISDHHKMIFSVLRKTFAKGNRKPFSPVAIKSMIKALSANDVSCEELLEIFQLTLDASAPYK